jgi:hypothetical protein
MKEDVKDKWVAALRSGNYKQTRGALKKDGGHCCLGVLCEVLGHIAEWNGYKYSYNGSKSVLETYIQEEAGMKTPLGSWADNKRSLIELNDDGKSFDEIADIIEENWRSL